MPPCFRRFRISTMRSLWDSNHTAMKSDYTSLRYIAAPPSYNCPQGVRFGGSVRNKVNASITSGGRSATIPIRGLLSAHSSLRVTHITGRPKLPPPSAQNHAQFPQKLPLLTLNRTHFSNNCSGFIASRARFHAQKPPRGTPPKPTQAPRHGLISICRSRFQAQTVSPQGCTPILVKRKFCILNKTHGLILQGIFRISS